MKIYRYLLFCAIATMFLMVSCRKNAEINDDPGFLLNLSTDAVTFDTVFTTVGSTTKVIYLKNASSNRVVVSSVSLAMGSSSQFSLNVDGTPGYEVRDVEIGPNDSVFVFVKVTVDPQNSNSPLVIRDSIVITVNGNTQDIDLTAWGQDAHYIVADRTLSGGLRYKIVAGEHQNVTWTDDKPYLIYGYAVVDSTGSLTVEEGCRLHFYKNSGMWIYKGGSLKVNGTLQRPVTFQGSRLEPDYRNLPGQWDRIWINEGTTDNVINYAVIRNGFIGIQAETLGSDMGNRLVIMNTRIENMTGIGLLSRYYRISAGNSVFANCGGYSACLTTGGKYDFRHCTFANYWSYSSRQTPLLAVTNYFEDLANGIVYQGDLDSAYFGNCIVFGSNNEEVVLDSVAGSRFRFTFDHCLLKTGLNTSDAGVFRFCRINQDPDFTNKDLGDYTLRPGSWAIDGGNINIVLTSLIPLLEDLAGNNRTVNPPPDLGAYDYRP